MSRRRPQPQPMPYPNRGGTPPPPTPPPAPPPAANGIPFGPAPVGGSNPQGQPTAPANGIPFSTGTVSTSNPTASNATAGGVGGGGIPPTAFPTGGYPTGPTPAQPTGTGEPPPPAPPNMLSPRAGEQYYLDNQQFWTQGPMNSQGYWDQNQGAVTGPTSSQTYATNFSGGGPLPPPNLDPYYERARGRTAEDVNRAYGARGMYNSGAALSGLSDAMTGLSAEQANREADYGLQYDASRRAWDELGGNLAGQADQSAVNQFLAGSGAAGQLDMTGLQYTNTGADAAFAAQGAERARLQDFFTNISQPALASAGLTQESFMQLLQQDPALMEAAMAYFTGTSAEAQNQDYRDQEKIKADSEWAVDMFGKAATLGAGA